MAARIRGSALRPVHLAGLRPSHLAARRRSEEHTSELQSRQYLVCRLLLEKKNKELPHALNHLHRHQPVTDVLIQLPHPWPPDAHKSLRPTSAWKEVDGFHPAHAGLDRNSK